MLRPSVCDYSDAYILFKETILFAAGAGGAKNSNNKKVTFRNCAPFTDCISGINNTNR